MGPVVCHFKPYASLCLRARVEDTPIASLGFIVLQGSLVGGGVSLSLYSLQADRKMSTCSVQLMRLVLAERGVG